jgi:hypothetical protein
MNFDDFWNKLEAERLPSSVHFNYIMPIIADGHVRGVKAHIGDRVTDLDSVCGIFKKGGDPLNILHYGLARHSEINDRDDVIVIPCDNVNITHPLRYGRYER